MLFFIKLILSIGIPRAAYGLGILDPSLSLEDKNISPLGKLWAMLFIGWSILVAICIEYAIWFTDYIG